MLGRCNGGSAERKLGGKAEAMPHEEHWGFMALRGRQAHTRQGSVRAVAPVNDQRLSGSAKTKMALDPLGGFNSGVSFSRLPSSMPSPVMIAMYCLPATE
jgi:hypothetical protein